MNMQKLDVVLPAAGIGSRMQSAIPKQYLQVAGATIIEHSIHALLSHPKVNQVIVALNAQDECFATLPIAKQPRVLQVIGGEERVDSVLAGLKVVSSQWVMVHDAARPCIAASDIDRLLEQGMQHPVGAILGRPVVDTMKRCNQQGEIIETVCREAMWHALTPQLFQTEPLINAIEKALQQGAVITDESSAMEFMGASPLLVEGSEANIKVTRPEDLQKANEYLRQFSQVNKADK